MTTSPLVPGLLPVAIDDHAYLCEPDYERTTVQVIRQQADQSFEPGEQSLTPLGLWRRSQESWHHGAGQPFLNGRTGLSAYSQINADPERFRASKGLDPWTHGQISLLNATINVWPSANTNLAVLVAGTYVFVADGTEVYVTASAASASGYPINLLSYANSGFESGAGTWVAGGGSTIAASATTAIVGAQSLKITSNGSTTPSAHTPTGLSGIAVQGGRTYVFVCAIRAGTTGRTWTETITWYDSGGSTISTSSSTSSADSNAIFTQFLNLNLPAPATAAFASINLQINSTAASGEDHYVDAVAFMPNSTGQQGMQGIWNTTSINGADPAATVNSITSDGDYVWAAMGLSGIHRTRAVNGAITTTANVPGPLGASHFCHLVGYANGRLLAAGSPSAGPNTQRNVLYEIGDPLGTPDWYGGTGITTPLFTHPNPNFVWTFIQPGRNCVYAGGNAGGNGEVYRITLEQTSTALGAATHATYLPDGEAVFTLQFYAGGIVMATSKGVRLGQADGQGNIDYGPLVETSWPVKSLEPQGRFCWYGLTKYDGSSSGLGRVDLGFFTDTLTPAWATDLMGPAQADVVSAATWSWKISQSAVTPDMRLFAVSGVGVFAEDLGSRVASGTMQTGTIRYGTTEPKLTRSLDLRHHALPAGASIAVEMQRNQSGTWESLGSSSTTSSTGPVAPLDALSEQAESLEFRFTLTRATAYTGPELTRWTAKVLPLPSTIDETFTLNLHMKTTVDTTAADGQPRHVDVPTEVTYLKGLEQSRQLVTLQLGSEQFTVYVVQSQFKATNWEGPKRRFAEGTLALVLQTVRG